MKQEDKIRMIQKWVQDLHKIDDTLVDIIYGILSVGVRPDSD